MAFAAVRGGDAWSLAALGDAVPALAWWLLFGNLFWVLAYDTEYAMVDRDDDLKIGIKTSAITLGRFDVAGGVGVFGGFFGGGGGGGLGLWFGWGHLAGGGGAGGGRGRALSPVFRSGPRGGVP